MSIAMKVFLGHKTQINEGGTSRRLHLFGFLSLL